MMELPVVNACVSFLGFVSILNVEQNARGENAHLCAKIEWVLCVFLQVTRFASQLEIKFRMSPTPANRYNVISVDVIRREVY